MTSTVNSTTEAFLHSGIYEYLSLRVDVVATVLLLTLLVEREVLGAYLGERGGVRLQAIRVAVTPLLVAFALIVLARTTGHR